MTINTTIVATLSILIFLGCGNESTKESKQKIDEKTINVSNESTSKENIVEKITELKFDEEISNENMQETKNIEEEVYEGVPLQKSDEELASESLQSGDIEEEVYEGILFSKSDEELASEISNNTQNITDIKSDEELEDENLGEKL